MRNFLMACIFLCMLHGCNSFRPISGLGKIAGLRESKIKTALNSKGEDFSANKGIDIDPKRFILYNSLALALALGSNFLGVTSNLMTATNPTYFRSLGLDQLYPIDHYRKNADVVDGYEFLFPEYWLADQALIVSNVREMEKPRELRNKASSIQPDAAYGPVGGDGKENVSVIKSRLMPGFVMRDVLGEPREAADKLLRTVIAPPSSGKTYDLINAGEETRNGFLTYTFEYTVRNDEKNFFQHAISVIVARGTELYTLTATAPEKGWNVEGSKIRAIADSFKLTTGGALPNGFY